MRHTLLAILLCLPLPAQTDISGKWTGGQFTINFKQEGGKLSGTAGPMSSEQYPLQDLVFDGDHLTFHVGKFGFDLHIEGTIIKGQADMGGTMQPVVLERVDQQGNAPLVFEVASVKRTPPDAPPGQNSKLDPGRMTMSGITLKSLIRRAYDVKEYQITGPDWITTERYEIAAKFPPKYGVDQIMTMLQNLLADRFKVEIRRESREMAVYALTLGKNGVKMTPTEMGPGRTNTSPGKMVAQKLSMPRLAELLSGLVDRPVIDSTGLSGVYDMTLEWAPNPNVISENGPAADIYTAIQQQLGLKLEARKAPIDMFVIERAERSPSEN